MSTPPTQPPPTPTTATGLRHRILKPAPLADVPEPTPGQTLGGASLPGVAAPSNVIRLPLTSTQLEAIVDQALASTDELGLMMETFWGRPLQLRLFSVSPKVQYFWQTEEYYVSQVPLDERTGSSVQLRITQPACQRLIQQAFGCRANEPPFTPDAPPGADPTFTPFETFTLEAWSRDILQAVFQHLLDRSVRPRRYDSLVHVVWLLLQVEQQEARYWGNLILSAPSRLFRVAPGANELERATGTTVDAGGAEALASAEGVPPAEAASESSLKLSALDECLMEAHAEARVRVGKTRLRLEELQHLEVGDLVYLEQSHRQRMALQDPLGEGMVFFFVRFQHYRPLRLPAPEPVRPSSSRSSRSQERHPQPMHASSSSHESHSAKSTSAPVSREAVWDNLHIEVQAEFEPTRIPLRQLRQMTEGLIVEIGDLARNTVRLHVEGKTLAEGELVIVGDRFGVLISRMAGATEDEPGQSATMEAFSAPAEGLIPDDLYPSDWDEPLDPAVRQELERSDDDILDELLSGPAGTSGDPGLLPSSNRPVANRAATPPWEDNAAAGGGIAPPRKPPGAGDEMDFESETAKAESLMEEVDKFLNDDFDENLDLGTGGELPPASATDEEDW
ncbi:MAG: FliM/FliN family flagellar motor switch protein [Candidatus Melainabacteria bacterium]|nr:FliM/FliN family flagellar motor switch protein [Candidatus Melainabacteria bacterium]